MPSTIYKTSASGSRYSWMKTLSKSYWSCESKATLKHQRILFQDTTVKLRSVNICSFSKRGPWTLGLMNQHWKYVLPLFACTGPIDGQPFFKVKI